MTGGSCFIWGELARQQFVLLIRFSGVVFASWVLVVPCFSPLFFFVLFLVKLVLKRRSLFSLSLLSVCVCVLPSFFPPISYCSFFLTPSLRCSHFFFVTYPFPDSCFLCSCLSLKHVHILGHTHAREQTHTHTACTLVIRLEQ